MPTKEDFQVLRDVEVEWLSKALGDAIANLGYPVGCGLAPHPEQLKHAAETLFERYAKMIEMATQTRNDVLVKALQGALVALESMPRPTVGLVNNSVQAAFDKRVAAIHAALTPIPSADRGSL